LSLELILTIGTDTAYTEIGFRHFVFPGQLELRHYTFQASNSTALRAMKMDMMMRVNMLVAFAFARIAFRKTNHAVEVNHTVNVTFVFQSIQHAINRNTIAQTLRLFLYFRLRQCPACVGNKTEDELLGGGVSYLLHNR
jgi:hypothetical protein